jgi:hypothetical protein
VTGSVAQKAGSEEIKGRMMMAPRKYCKVMDDDVSICAAVQYYGTVLTVADNLASLGLLYGV